MADNLNTMVEQDRLELMLRYPFYGRVICQCKLMPVSSTDAPIACNDCRRIYLAESAYMALPAEDRLLVLTHEILHITLRHAFRRGNRDEERFSFAADAEILPLLQNDFPQASMSGYKQAWDGLTAEEIYEQLPIKLPEEPPLHFFSPQGGLPIPDASDGEQSDCDNDPSGNCENNAGNDHRDRDDKDCENEPDSDAQPGNDNQSSESGNDGDADGNGGGIGMGGGEDSNPRDDMPHSAFDAETEIFCRELSAEVQIGLEKQRGRGKQAVSLLRLLEEINVAHIDWKSLLRQFIREVRGGGYCWLPPNRRFISRGLYLPGRRQKLFRGVVALDTSGSTAEDLPGFVGEVERLIRSFGKFELTVIECDAAVGNVTVVSSDTKPHDWRKHRFCGGGGTDFTPVFEYIRAKRLRPDVLVFFTDGDRTCPQTNPGYPVLWLLTSEGEPPVSWGIPIKMEG